MTTERRRLLSQALYVAVGLFMAAMLALMIAGGIRIYTVMHRDFTPAPELTLNAEQPLPADELPRNVAPPRLTDVSDVSVRMQIHQHTVLAFTWISLAGLTLAWALDPVRGHHALGRTVSVMTLLFLLIQLGIVIGVVTFALGLT